MSQWPGSRLAGCANLSVRGLITETFNCHNIPGRRAADMTWNKATTTRFRPNPACLPLARAKFKKSKGTSISLLCVSIWLQCERKRVDPKLPSNPTLCKYPTGPLAKLLHLAVGRQFLQLSIACDLLDSFKKSFHCSLAKYVCSSTSGTYYHHSDSSALPLSVHNEVVEKVTWYKYLGTIINHELITAKNTNNAFFSSANFSFVNPLLLLSTNVSSNPFSNSISLQYYHPYQQ